jgi:hypothetical protein
MRCPWKRGGGMGMGSISSVTIKLGSLAGEIGDEWGIYGSVLVDLVLLAYMGVLVT